MVSLRRHRDEQETPPESPFESLPLELSSRIAAEPGVAPRDLARLARASSTAAATAAAVDYGARWCCRAPPTPSEVEWFVERYYVRRLVAAMTRDRVGAHGGGVYYTIDNTVYGDPSKEYPFSSGDVYWCHVQPGGEQNESAAWLVLLRADWAQPVALDARPNMYRRKLTLDVYADTGVIGGGDAPRLRHHEERVVALGDGGAFEDAVQRGMDAVRFMLNRARHTLAVETSGDEEGDEESDNEYEYSNTFARSGALGVDDQRPMPQAWLYDTSRVLDDDTDDYDTYDYAPPGQLATESDRLALGMRGAGGDGSRLPPPLRSSLLFNPQLTWYVSQRRATGVCRNAGDGTMRRCVTRQALELLRVATARFAVSPRLESGARDWIAPFDSAAQSITRELLEIDDLA